MFGKSKETSLGTETKMKISTIIGEGAVFDGNLSAPDSMRIDGTVNGNIRCEKELILGASAAVEGNISAQNVMISGKVNGDIFANGKLELLSTGKIAGNISAKSLVIDENANFDGRCTMTTASSAPRSLPVTNTESSPAISVSDKDDSKETESASAEEPPSRNFVRISADSMTSETADDQSEPAPTRQRSRAKATAQQNSSHSKAPQQTDEV